MTLRITRVDVPGPGVPAPRFDLDGNDVSENAVGLITAAVQRYLEVDLSAAVNARLADEVDWRLAVARCSDGTAVVEDGAQLPVSTLFDPSGRFADPGWVSAHAVAIEVTPLGGGRWEGRVGMALRADEATAAFVRPLAAYPHDVLRGIFDTAPQDGVVTAEEMTASGLVKSMFAPDLGGRDALISSAIAFTATELPAN